ncbi:MAG: hypothetical protein HYW49_13095 [Deltaproteobacteria bacterium]|nr:hypothetical protein [Deltaproteobacteria bacterium]
MSTENWVPLLDYAVLKGVSTSTLRRYIKAKKVEYKIENGRYLLRSDAPRTGSTQDFWNASSTQDGISVFQRVRELEQEISELKMLVAIYEEKLAQSHGQRS